MFIMLGCIRHPLRAAPQNRPACGSHIFKIEAGGLVKLAAASGVGCRRVGPLSKPGGVKGSTVLLGWSEVRRDDVENEIIAHEMTDACKYRL